jgi:hypothetical protein
MRFSLGPPVLSGAARGGVQLTCRHVEQLFWVLATVGLKGMDFKADLR